MSNLLSVGFCALSILGLSIILAAVSHANYDTYRGRIGFPQVLGTPDFQFVIDSGLILLELGILGNTSLIWVRALGGILAAVFGIHALRAWRKSRARKQFNSAHALS